MTSIISAVIAFCGEVIQILIPFIGILAYIVVPLVAATIAAILIGTLFLIL